MRLSVVGAGPAYTDRPGASGACYLVRDERSSLLLDLGHGSFARLAELLDPADLDAVVVSHLHPDHFVDLVPLRHYLRYEREPARVRVAGTRGSCRPTRRAQRRAGIQRRSIRRRGTGPGPVASGDLAVESDG